VDRFTDSFNEHANNLREDAGRQDFDNLQHTLAGLETGQQTRHGLNKEERDSILGKKQKSVAEQIQDTLEWLLLNDKQYRLSHNNLIAALQSAEHKAETAINQIASQLSDAKIELETMIKNAAKLPNGASVFRDKEGKIRTAAGEIVSDDLAATIIWSGNEPSYEEFKAQEEYTSTLEDNLNEARGIETELGSIRGHASDNDKPPSQEGLDALTRRTDELEDRIEAIQKNVIERNAEITSAPTELEPSSESVTTEQSMSVEKPKL